MVPDVDFDLWLRKKSAAHFNVLELLAVRPPYLPEVQPDAEHLVVGHGHGQRR